MYLQRKRRKETHFEHQQQNFLSIFRSFDRSFGRSLVGSFGLSVFRSLARSVFRSFRHNASTSAHHHSSLTHNTTACSKYKRHNMSRYWLITSCVYVCVCACQQLAHFDYMKHQCEVSAYANNLHIIVTPTKCTVKCMSAKTGVHYFACINCCTYINRSFSRSVVRSSFLCFVLSITKSHILWPATTSLSHAYSILRRKTPYFGVCNNVLRVKTAICG